jgi:hypothetical protein
MLTVREVMKALSHEHPDAPAVVRMERLRYEPDENDPDAFPTKWVLVPEETEVELVAVSSVRPTLDGRVVIE